VPLPLTALGTTEEEPGTKWILVAGSGRNPLDPKLVKTSQSLGTKLARAGFGLITCGWPGVDHLVARAFAEGLNRTGGALSVRLLHVLEEGRTPDFSGGQYVRARSEEEAWKLSIAKADAVILIGGLGGTYETGRIARQMSKPVLPLADTREGGHDDAYRTYFEMERTWAMAPIPPLKHVDFLRLGGPAPQVVDDVIWILEQVFGLRDHKEKGLPRPIQCKNRASRSNATNKPPVEFPESRDRRHTSMKQISKAEILRVATEQMAAHGSTTTLEIKNKLRTEGFFAEQTPVSQFTKQLALENLWRAAPEGDHLRYLPADKASQPSPVIGHEIAKGTPERPQIGIITALTKEFTAMKAALLDCRPHNIPGHGAGRRYVLGRLDSQEGGAHWVALALADQGNNMAATRATLLLEHFSSIEAIIMVGIAGAVPCHVNPENHVRLGDIVVSNKKGVIQYDMKKLREIRACPVPPNARLLEAVRLLEVDELTGERPWVEATESILKKLRWKKPLRKKDRLFASDDPSRQLSHPKDPRRVANLPRVFLGPIASSNELLKRPKKRDSLQAKFGVRAVEMEGSGIADATWTHDKGYLVVRGTCDYCDSHKDDIWQQYAAALAAGYTKALIESIPSPTLNP